MKKPDIIIYVDGAKCNLRISNGVTVQQLSMALTSLMTETITTIQQCRKNVVRESIAKGPDQIYQ